MKTRIVIDRMRMDGGKPAIVVLNNNGIRFADEVVIHGESVLTGIATGKSPVGSARVWLETEAEVTCV